MEDKNNINGAGEKPYQEIELTIPIVPNIETTAIHTAESIMEYMKFDSNKKDEVKIALIEALINAFEHSKSSDNKVYIKFIIKMSELQVIVKDYGAGFNPESVPKPDIKEKLKSSHKRGWGLKIIENLMDSFDITSNELGTTLVMTKYCQDN